MDTGSIVAVLCGTECERLLIEDLITGLTGLEGEVDATGATMACCPPVPVGWLPIGAAVAGSAPLPSKFLDTCWDVAAGA